MRTLNDILTANCLKYKDHKTCEECRYWEDCGGKKVNELIIQAVKDFFKDFRDYLPPVDVSEHAKGAHDAVNDLENWLILVDGDRKNAET